MSDEQMTTLALNKVNEASKTNITNKGGEFSVHGFPMTPFDNALLPSDPTMYYVVSAHNERQSPWKDPTCSPRT